jgi:NTP pyrophosphatase (non-canonical NTP hydrolase)
MKFPNVVESKTATSEDIRKLYARCLAMWGVNAQENMLKEECAELIVAISHFDRGRNGQDEVLEELCDVLFMIGEILYLYGFTREEMLRAMDEKITRTFDRVAESEKKLAETSAFKGGTKDAGREM